MRCFGFGKTLTIIVLAMLTILAGSSPGWTSDFSDMVVVSTPTDFAGLWVQSPGRAFGFRIIANWPVATGDRLHVTGTLSWQDGIPTLAAPVLMEREAGTPVKPLFFTGRSLANDRREILSYSGVTPVGLLAAAGGRVTCVDSLNHVFYIDDGSQLMDGMGPSGNQFTGLRIAHSLELTPPTIIDYILLKGMRSVTKTTLTEAAIVNGESRSAGTTLHVPMLYISPLFAHTSSLSTPTQCAEEDNVNIPIAGSTNSYWIEAMHPAYEVGTDSCLSDSSNCPPPDPGYPFTPDTVTLYDDHVTVVEAVREANWWRPNGMSVSVDQGAPVTDMHYVVVYRKIADSAEWPQFFVLYMDGNCRLIPHPPIGRDSVCFGSSVIVGPAQTSSRPIAEIASVHYSSAAQTMEVSYAAGGTSVLTLQEVDRTMARVRVTLTCPGNTLPVATIRSMFVTEGNADVDHVQWKDAFDRVRDDPVMTFPGGDGKEWLFHRETRSAHNVSAPDIRITLK